MSNTEYKINESVSDVFRLIESHESMDASKYIKTSKGTIPPQTSIHGGTYGETPQIKIKDMIPQVDEDTGDVTYKSVDAGFINADIDEKQDEYGKQLDEILKQEEVAFRSSSRLVAPPIKRIVTKAVLNSPLFGKVTLPIVEYIKGSDCLVLCLDSSDGFSFIPPASKEQFTITYKGNNTDVLFVGQSFVRNKFTYIVTIPVGAEL